MSRNYLGLPVSLLHSRRQLASHKKAEAGLALADQIIPFLEGQVTPFFLQTPDFQSIYAWHIIPLPVYLQNEEALSLQDSGPAQDVEESESLRILKADPEARVVVCREYQVE